MKKISITLIIILFISLSPCSSKSKVELTHTDSKQIHSNGFADNLNGSNYNSSIGMGLTLEKVLNKKLRYEVNDTNNNLLYNKFTADVFTFDVPANWKKLNDKDLLLPLYKKDSLNNNSKSYKHFSIPSSILALSAFASPQMDATVYAVRELTDVSKNEDSVLIQVGLEIINSKLVKQVFKNKITSLNGTHGLYTECEIKGGDRILIWSFYDSDLPYQTIRLGIIMHSGYYEMNSQTINHILNSLEIKIERNFTVGTKPCLLSYEAQKYLLVREESNYECTNRILIIQEPHYDPEGQWSLYKGLETFFKENPALINETVFLSEGLPTDETLSVDALVNVDAQPKEETIRKVLGSFLITGYIAYDWKYQSNIPILGTEDKQLYNAGADLWLKIQHKNNLKTLKRWKINVQARNKNIANTLVSKTKVFDNPILFVGGMHLHNNDFLIENNPVLGISDYLKDEKIGYIYLESFSNPANHELERNLELYVELFTAQQRGDYQEYIDLLIWESIVDETNENKNEKSNRNITVRPSPEAAADYLKDSKNNNADDNQNNPENNSGRSVVDQWDDFRKNPENWEKETEIPDPIQPKGGKSIREYWKNKKTGEPLGVHHKDPPGKTRDGKPKHPHPFKPKIKF